MAGWELWTLEGIAHTTEQLNALEPTAQVLSVTPVNQLVVDNVVLDKLKELVGTDIAPIVNNLGETIGYTASAAASSNGVTGLSNTWVEVHRAAQTVTQDLIDANIPLLEGGSTSSLNVGDTVTTVGVAAGAGVGGALGTGVGGTALATVAGPAIAAALGIEWGVALYELAPDFWTEVADKLTEAGKFIGDKIITFFDTNGNNYYDQETINIIKDALIRESYMSPTPQQSATNPEVTDGVLTQPVNYSPTVIVYNSETFDTYYTTEVISGSAQGTGLKTPDNSWNFGVAYVSDVPFTIRTVTYKNNVPDRTTDRVVSTPETRTTDDNPQGLPWYWASIFSGNGKTNSEVAPKTYSTTTNLSAWYMARELYRIIFNGTSSTLPSPADLQQKDNGNGQLVSPISTAETSPLQRPSTDPEATPYEYYDPTISTEQDPYTPPRPTVDPTPQPDPVTDPAPDPHPVEPTTPPTDPQNPNPEQDNTDEGSTDPGPAVPYVPITGMGNIFNPSAATMRALGGYLWSSTTIEDIQKLFSNPTDGIIGFMKLYATPDTGSSAEICFGYLHSGVYAPLVTSQVVEVDCGVVDVPLNKENATDYPPYTTVQAYLPFIGVVPLNGYDLVGSVVRIRYRVDCYTGACIAQIECTRGDMDAVLYEFSGNCAQQIPLTSGSFVQAIGNTISGAIIGAVHGGAVGAAIGAGSALIHSNVEVGRSGNLSSNAGILGSRKPYLIITRAISADAANYSYFYGYPANATVYLSNVHGYVRVKDIVLHCACTSEERNEIIHLLQEGVYL